jgi:hypothetical protein
LTKNSPTSNFLPKFPSLMTDPCQTSRHKILKPPKLSISLEFNFLPLSSCEKLFHHLMPQHVSAFLNLENSCIPLENFLPFRLRKIFFYLILLKCRFIFGDFSKCSCNRSVSETFEYKNSRQSVKWGEKCFLIQWKTHKLKNYCLFFTLEISIYFISKKSFSTSTSSHKRGVNLKLD